MGRLFGEEVDGFKWLMSELPKHHKHPNYDTAPYKSLIHVDKPMCYQETKNADMFMIMDSLQRKHLGFLLKQASDPVRFSEDLKLIYDVECGVETREAAENRVKVVENKAGILICHGDKLTKERFETCKRLAQSGASAVERFEFMPVFRIGMFHLRMNKTIKDLESCMPMLVNVEDELSLGYFRTTLGLREDFSRA